MSSDVQPVPPLPADAEGLRTLERWLELHLAAVRERLAALDVAPPPVPDAGDAAEGEGAQWWVTWYRTPPGWPRRGDLHRAGCWMKGAPTLTGAEAAALLADARHAVTECPACQPARAAS
ncbi:DUF6233 domain-containing protein [Streptomyces buecherae]|uniref:Uncharacterized protein n=1 Tax=Streptomyces buecherae TaxID=2763006 RepID=A0A7H8NKQ1_9ACTN|nr:DUF6233 domain-containing protein [Streptomyces buecherae]QKW55032.1 hypothetical protein HUT08_36490 [Streptomyces buecherae]